ncbi:MAG: tol-pal system protein YbgF [candidate division NC10 bacterium]|nr:tol-pal system protein YbgF [candidate division NC10 bacterium]MDE2484413.1 tol-pal system protein YbgF [candidate division NC10 bacterium]
MRLHPWLAAALTLSALTVGCEGDMPLRMVQRDVDSTKSELAAVARTAEGSRLFIEERLRKVEDRLDKSERAQRAAEERLRKIDQERKEATQGFMQSQAALTVKLDELTTEVRLAQGQTEGIGHGITEMNRRVDEFGRRLDGFDKQVSQASGAAHGAAAVSQQTAKQVTVALQQMAQQTNAAIEQVNATAQLALAEARKPAKGKPITGPARSSHTEPQPLSPTVAPIAAPPVVPPTPATTASAQGVAPPSPAAQTAESPPPTVPPTKPAARMESADELYRNALNDYAKGNYELAISSFRSQIELYPNSSLLPNARYWLGESYYSQKNYDQAIKELALLVKQYPDHPKVASAMLKQGFAYLEMGDKPKARTVLDNLLKQFPKSQEARWAKERLNQVK